MTSGIRIRILAGLAQLSADGTHRQSCGVILLPLAMAALAQVVLEVQQQ
jgi:hypothetical protein